MSSPHFSKISFNITFHLRLGLSSDLSSSSFPTKTLYAPLLSLIRATCPAHFILLDLITQILFGEEYNHKAPRYVVFSSPLLPRPSEAQIPFSAPYSRTPSAYAPPSI